MNEQAEKEVKAMEFNYPVGQRVIIKDNSNNPYKLGTMVGVEVVKNSVFPMVDIDGADKNPYMVMGIIRRFDLNRNKALDKLTGIEQWNVMSENYTMEIK